MAALTTLADAAAHVSAASETQMGHKQQQDIFPQRLFGVLSDESNAGAISWLPHGQGFIITDRKKFATEVLPRYFKQTKFTSFTRKLKRWGFRRITEGHELGAYYHSCLRRGMPDLCTQMHCINYRAKFADAKKIAVAPSSLLRAQAQASNRSVKMSFPTVVPKPHVTSVMMPHNHMPAHQHSCGGIPSATAAAIVSAAMRALQRSSAITSSNSAVEALCTKRQIGLPLVAPTLRGIMAKAWMAHLNSQQDGSNGRGLSSRASAA